MSALPPYLLSPNLILKYVLINDSEWIKDMLRIYLIGVNTFFTRRVCEMGRGDGHGPGWVRGGTEMGGGRPAWW